jgi:hypothetical protein
MAAKHHVSPKWLRLISEGALDDPVFVAAIREAAATPELWALVAWPAQNALVLPTVKIKLLGGSLDDLLAMLLDSMEILRHPANQNFARHTSALQHVDQSLDIHLQSRTQDRLDGIVTNAGKAGRASAAKRRENSRASKWAIEVEESRKRGIPKEQKYRDIERREILKPGSVKKAVLRLSKAAK